MNYILILRQEAEKDLAETYRWYNQQVTGLGAEFMAAVDRALASIQDNPARFPILYAEVRRALLRRFPYGIFFVLDNERISVLAVMHTARDPAKWRTP